MITDEELDIAVGNILATEDGRLFFWAVLEKSGYLKSGFQEPDQLLFKEGQRSIGNLLFFWMERQPTDYYLLMKDEAAARTQRAVDSLTEDEEEY